MYLFAHICTQLLFSKTSCPFHRVISWWCELSVKCWERVFLLRAELVHDVWPKTELIGASENLKALKYPFWIQVHAQMLIAAHTPYQSWGQLWSVVKTFPKWNTWGHSPSGPLRAPEPAEKLTSPQQSLTQVRALSVLSSAPSVTLGTLTQHS